MNATYEGSECLVSIGLQVLAARYQSEGSQHPVQIARLRDQDIIVSPGSAFP